MSKEQTQENHADESNVTVERLLGADVMIVKGAWAGSKGTIMEKITENGAWRIKLKNGIQLAWSYDEFKVLSISN